MAGGNIAGLTTPAVDMIMPSSASAAHQGIGMTSLRTRQRLIARLRDRGIENEAVLQAIEQTPRHLFIDPAIAHKAYEDTALPIGQQQTISQPFMVAWMTQLLLAGNKPIKKVLEVGTGCGYQTAILSRLTAWVFTVERIGSLQEKAKNRLLSLGCRNISFLNADGFLGWDSNQPFDAILAAAAPTAVPQALLDQLRIGGRLVIPVGDHENQNLCLILRTKTGYDRRQLEAVRFVPMLSGKKT